MPKSKRYPMQEETGCENSPFVCGAKTRSGGRCKNHPVAGKKRCRMHGGTSRSGKDHWNYQHGFWSIEEKQRRAQTMRLMKVWLNEADMF